MFDFWQTFCIFVFKILKLKFMAIVDIKGGYHGQTGDMVFQMQNGQQILRSKPVHYHDRKSEVQLEQRDKMKAVQMLYRRLKPAVKGCFELMKEGQRDCDRFMSLNLLRMNTVSDGSLPVLDYRIVDGRIECDIISGQWSRGDVLRFISLVNETVEFEDITVDPKNQTTIVRDVKPNGMYAFVHLRNGRKGRLASPQQLIANS